MSKVLRYLSENTLFHAFDKCRLEREKAEYKSLPWHKKVQKGVLSEFRTIPKVIALVTAMHLALAPLENRGTQASFSISQLTIPRICIYCILIPSIVEEIFFRGIVQSSLKRLAKNIRSLSTNPFIQNTFSPSAAIHAANTLFAAAHFGNAGNYLSILSSSIQFTQILTHPSYSIQFETSKNLIVPMSMHITRNACVFLPIIIIKMVSKS